MSTPATPAPLVAALQERVVTIGGTTLTLRFSILAIEALREHWNVETDVQVYSRLQNFKGVRDIVAIIWACCQSRHPEVTYEQVLKWLDEEGLERFAELVSLVVTAATPRDEGGKKPQAAQEDQNPSTPPSN